MVQRAWKWVRWRWTLPARLGDMNERYFELSDRYEALERRCEGAEAALQRSVAARAADAAAMEEPRLTPAQIERLALLAEECGGLQEMIGKTLRYGWNSASPYGGPPNRVGVEREMGDVRAAIDILIEAGDARGGDVDGWRRKKHSNVWRWLHHQAPAASANGCRARM